MLSFPYAVPSAAQTQPQRRQTTHVPQRIAECARKVHKQFIVKLGYHFAELAWQEVGPQEFGVGIVVLLGQASDECAGCWWQNDSRQS